MGIVRSPVLQCPRCHKTLPHQQDFDTRCNKCQLRYRSSASVFSYDYDSILFKNFPKSFLLNKVLNNNGYISYTLLKSSSCALPDRENVHRFQDYVASRFQGKTLLDMGCGPMPLPGYLEFTRNRDIDVYGLDPIAASDFTGFRVIGCSEFTPFVNNQFDAIIFATSLDHVCSLPQTIREVFRILRPQGKVFIFMSDQHIPIRKRIFGYLYRLQGKLLKIQTPKTVVRKGRYVYYKNEGVVFFLPPGAKDPFHSFFESPQVLSKLFKKYGFTLDDMLYRDQNEVFLTFEKTPS